MKQLFLAFVLLLSCFTTFSTATVPINFTQKRVDDFTKKYGKKATKRLLLWDKLLVTTKDKKTLEKLKSVNDFFNKIRYKLDPAHWGKKDYWASPFEFLGTGAGDCEDYAIAKYFSLIKLGIPEEKLRITYVKYKGRGRYAQAHMVLTYYHKPNSTPVVLDNINKKLKLATKRKDLKPVYSFNANGLWQAQNKGQSSRKVGKNTLRSWKDLMSRI